MRPVRALLGPPRGRECRRARGRPLWLPGALVSAVLTGCGGAGAYLDFESATPHASVAIVSARTPLIAGQSGTVQAAVVNTSENAATDVLVQVAAPIGFEYKSATCLSSGASIGPPVSVQQLEGGLVFPSFPAGTEVPFFFTGVTTGAGGSQVVFVIAANVPGDLHPEDNGALRAGGQRCVNAASFVTEDWRWAPCRGS